MVQNEVFISTHDFGDHVRKVRERTRTVTPSTHFLTFFINLIGLPVTQMTEKQPVRYYKYPHTKFGYHTHSSTKSQNDV